MTINYNVTGEDRKHLVRTLGEFLQEKPVYMQAPTYGYTVGEYTVDRNGMITAPEDAPKTEEELIAELSARGFTPADGGDTPETDTETIAEPEEAAPNEGAEAPDIAPEAEPDALPAAEDETPYVGEESPVAVAGGEAPTAPEEDAPNANEENHVLAVENETPPTEAEEAGDSPASEAPTKEDGKPPVLEGPANPPAREDTEPMASAEADGVHLTISIPRSLLSDDALERLKQIVANKEILFKRALSADSLPIEATEKEISFPWFTLKGITGEAAAYSQFIVALCQMAKEQKRILDKPYDGDNDRFAMRIFMVRLGMKGAEFALARKLMMQDLTGNSGWRFGAPPKKQPGQEKTATLDGNIPADDAVAGTDKETVTVPEGDVSDTASETPAESESATLDDVPEVPADSSNNTTDNVPTQEEVMQDEPLPQP